MAQAALGFRDHSGWAVMVAMGGDPRSPDVLLRDRVELLDDPALPRQVYHAAVGRGLAEAAELIAAVERSARNAARTAIADAVAELRDAGHGVTGVALGLDRMALPEDLAKVLGNHTLLHVGEGKLYREALADSAGSLGLPTIRCDFKTLAATARPVLGTAVAEHLTELRRQIGPPWARDQKDAALAAWLALVSG